MERNEIIAVVEEAIGKSLNEEALGTIIDGKLQKALEPIDKKLVKIGELNDDTQPKKITFSQYLGDVRRAAMGDRDGADAGQRLKYLKPEQLIKVNTGINKALYEGTDAAGGYLVPTEESRELLNVATELYSVVPGLCRQVPMRTNQITFPTLTSGLTAYWIPEATADIGTVDAAHQSSGEKIASSLVLGQMAIVAYVCAVKVVVSNQLLDDSDPQIDGILRALFAEALGDEWDDACLTGAGAATDPITGLDNKVATNVLAAGALFNYDDVIDLLFGVIDNDSKANPVTLGTTKAEKVMMKLKDGDGQYLYKGPREAVGLPTVWGANFYRNGNISNVLGVGANETKLYAGDFRRHGYAGRRMGVTVAVNPWAEPYYSYNQSCFRAEFRVGFNVDHEKYFSTMSGVPTV